ncbi:MAG: HupE/UreJ family protein [Alphaproteobacteria bacterium]|nr:HupE/UreJ family protein [Alphaproteobacteria bacterium]MCB9795087.1 HupE/UreJ family protein [Alphaproteobacteria bacterium]
MILALLALALAHDVQPGAIALAEQTPGAWSLRLTPPQDGGGRPVLLAPRWPAGCRQRGDQLRCDGPLAGILSVPGLSPSASVLLRIQPLQGPPEQHLLTAGEARVRVGAPGRTGLVWLGAAHVLGGADHVFFVLGLALLTAGAASARDRRRQRLGAVTAFTLAHSLTLAAAASGALAAPTEAIECMIAASVLLLARECLTAEPTLTRRAPALVAGVMGLVHGVGFAGGLSEAGLAQEGLLRSVGLFNLGVELAQLAVLAAGVTLLALVRGAQGRRWLAYGIGLPAGVWMVERGVDWWAALAR